MPSKLLTPRWVAAHVLVALFVVACTWLGWWQWQRAESSTGTIQNLGYALQWPLFGVAAIFMLRRVIRLESQQGESQGAERDGETNSAVDGQRAPAAPVSAADPVSQQHTRQPPRPRTWVAPTEIEEIDEELAAYNRYLAQLHERDQRRAG